MKLATSLLFAAIAIASAQSAAVVIPDLAKAKWTHDPKDNSDSVFLQADSKTGGMDLLVRYLAGHKIAAHWHSVAERLILLEGRITVRAGDAAETTITPGGLMLSPAKEPHSMACVSTTPCTFYIAWDGKLDTHKVQ